MDQYDVVDTEEQALVALHHILKPHQGDRSLKIYMETLHELGSELPSQVETTHLSTDYWITSPSDIQTWTASRPLGWYDASLRRLTLVRWHRCLNYGLSGQLALLGPPLSPISGILSA